MRGSRHVFLGFSWPSTSRQKKNENVVCVTPSATTTAATASFHFAAQNVRLLARVLRTCSGQIHYVEDFIQLKHCSRLVKSQCNRNLKCFKWMKYIFQLKSWWFATFFILDLKQISFTYASRNVQFHWKNADFFDLNVTVDGACSGGSAARGSDRCARHSIRLPKSRR